MKTGDILEIPIARGLAYFQITHFHNTKSGFSYGWFGRVLSGTTPVRPSITALQAACSRREQFGCFIGDHSSLSVVGNAPIPREAASFPICKTPSGVAAQPNSVWYLWNGQEERVTYRLPNDAVNLPIAEVVGIEILRQRITNHWAPALDVPAECIAPATKPFSFGDYPLVSVFWENQPQYGDIFGYLCSHGLFEDDDSSGVEIYGVGPFENSAALDWLNWFSEAPQQASLEILLEEFDCNPVRHAVTSARTMAAAHCISLCASSAKARDVKIRAIESQLGEPSKSLIRKALNAVSKTKLRSGLRALFEERGEASGWLVEMDELQRRLNALQLGRPDSA